MPYFSQAPAARPAFSRGAGIRVAQTRRLRWILLAVLVVLGGAMGFYLLRPARHGLHVGSVSVLGTDADLKLDRVHMVQNKKGKKDWELWADTAKVYRKKDETHLENLRMKLYPQSGDPTDVSADRGIMQNRSRAMNISGNVLIRTADGTTLKTDSLRFSPKEKQVDTDSRIVLQGDSFHLTGVGQRGKTAVDQYFLRENVQATITNADAIFSPRPADAAPASPAPEEGRGTESRRSP